MAFYPLLKICLGLITLCFSLWHGYTQDTNVQYISSRDWGLRANVKGVKKYIYFVKEQHPDTLSGKHNMLDDIEFSPTNKIVQRLLQTESRRLEVYHYDSLDRLVEFTSTDSNSYVHKYTLLYTYNDRGLLDKEQTLEDGVATSKFLYLYDAEGKIIEKQLYDRKDTLCYTKVFSYNGAGLVRQNTVRFPPEDAMRKDRNEYFYNDEGYLVEKKWYDNTGLLTQDTYRYDTIGRRTYYYHSDI